MKKTSNRSNSRGTTAKKGFKPSKGTQGRSDGRGKRVNLDNERVSKFDEAIERDSKKESANDIATWNRNPSLTKAAATYPFSAILGDPLDGKYTVPGIMIFDYSPTIGSGKDPVAFNQVFQAMYDWIVHANSRNYKYDFTDLAMYCTAGAELFAAICEPMRIYGIYKSYTEENRYLVDGLIEALGWDAQNFRDNLSRVWYELNDIIVSTRSIWIPNTIPVLKRWMDLNLHVYTDAPGKKSQIYAFRRARYWQLSQTGSNQGTSLVPASYEASTTTRLEFDRMTDFNSQAMTWTKYKSMLKLMILSLQASGDRGMIYGDIKAAYGDNAIFGMSSFPSDFAIKPEYNSEVLMQIENIEYSPFVQRFVVQYQGKVGNNLEMAPIWSCFIDPASGSDAYVDCTAKSKKEFYDNKYTRISPAAPSLYGYGSTNKHLLNTHLEGQPTPEAIMIATRFKTGAVVSEIGPVYINEATASTPTLDASGNWSEYFNPGATANPIQTIYAPSSCSTEIVHDCLIYTYSYDTLGTLEPQLQYAVYDQYPIPYSGSVGNDVSYNTLNLMAFDWHPFTYAVNGEWDSATAATEAIASWVMAYGDFDNYALMDDYNLRNLHHVAQFSAWGVPVLGGAV